MSEIYNYGYSYYSEIIIIFQVLRIQNDTPWISATGYHLYVHYAVKVINVSC